MWSTETAISLLLAQIHTVWEEPGKVATVLSLNMSGAYDQVIEAKLTHILQRIGLPQWLVGWIYSFIRGRMSTLYFEE